MPPKKNTPPPTLDLPPFEGRKPDGQSLKLTGTLELDRRLVGAHRLDDVVYVLTACRVTKITHGQAESGHLGRIEGLKIVRGAPVAVEDGEKLLADVFTAAGITIV
jgi:hypothetical protein